MVAATPWCADVAEQAQHGGALVQEEPDVALRFGCLRRRPSRGLPGPAGRRPCASWTSACSRRISSETSGPASRLGGAQQPVQQTGRLDERAAVLVRPVLREEQTHEREVVELAQIAGVVRGGHASVPGPLSGLRQVALRDPDPGLDRRDGSHVREEPRPVQLLGPVQECDGLVRFALGSARRPIATNQR